MKTVIILFIAVVTLTGCSQPDRATSVLEQQGYGDIVIHPITFRDLFYCSEDDQFITPFTAKTNNGSTVSGAVCSGLLKGATVRFD
jgi:ATP sulfurylase